jgi:hypothetical protein
MDADATWGTDGKVTDAEAVAAKISTVAKPKMRLQLNM